MADYTAFSAQLAAFETVFMETMLRFYTMVPNGSDALRGKLRQIAEDAIPPAGMDRELFQSELALLLARIDERLEKS